MLAVTGYRSTIVSELRELLPQGEEVAWIKPRMVMDEGPLLVGPEKKVVLDPPPLCERYLLCSGLLRPKSLAAQGQAETEESFAVNLIAPMRLCDWLLEHNPNARICVMGSESGFTWSHDGAYAAAKAALHRYVETKKLKPNQQLVCVAPSIIGDAGMTLRRADVGNLLEKMDAHPKKRFLRSAEVAKLIHFLLYVDEGYTTGTVIRMNGGPA